MRYIIITFIFFFVLRLISLSFSIRNEKRLLKKGAMQYGKFNSLLLTLAHIVYYFEALYEAYSRGTDFNCRSLYYGICLQHAVLRHIQIEGYMDGKTLYRSKSAH